MKPYFYINHNAIFIKPKNTQELWDVSAGNIGNSYIGYCTIKMLEGEFKRVEGIQNLWNFDETKINLEHVNNNFSKVILILQDHIRVDQSYYAPDYEKITNFLEKIKLPFIILSLGSNGFSTEYDPDLVFKLSKEKVRFLNVIADKTKEISCRGHYSVENLNKLGIKNTNPVGCHTYFLNPTKEIKKNNQLKNTVVQGAYIPSLENNKNIKFSYILQCTAEPENIFNRYNKFINFGFKFLRPRGFYLPFTIDKWQNIVKKNDFSIGGRAHGTILALNNGVPAVLTNSDLRAREMAELFKIPLMRGLSPDTNITKIYEELDFENLNKTFSGLYKNFLSFLEKNDLCLKQQ